MSTDTAALLDFAVDTAAATMWMLAVTRLTRLLTRDAITDFIRARVYGRYGQDSTIGYFSTCPWCVSIWVAFATAPLLIWLCDRSWWAMLTMPLAASYIASVLIINLESDDDEVDIHITND